MKVGPSHRAEYGSETCGTTKKVHGNRAAIDLVIGHLENFVVEDLGPASSRRSARNWRSAHPPVLQQLGDSHNAAVHAAQLVEDAFDKRDLVRAGNGRIFVCRRVVQEKDVAHCERHIDAVDSEVEATARSGLDLDPLRAGTRRAHSPPRRRRPCPASELPRTCAGSGRRRAAGTNVVSPRRRGAAHGAPPRSRARHRTVRAR